VSILNLWLDYKIIDVFISLTIFTSSFCISTETPLVCTDVPFEVSNPQLSGKLSPLSTVLISVF